MVDGRPAYRCRRGYTSATRPDPARAKNTYIREDQVLPYLAALAILSDGQEHHGDDPGQASQVTGPARTAELIDHLRSSGQTLIYDPQRRILRTGTEDCVMGTVGCSH